MRTIYVPQGRAREYMSLAINLYTGCSHGCIYCWARRYNCEGFANPHLRTSVPDFMKNLHRSLDKMHPSGQVLLCFTCDPYTEFQNPDEAYQATNLRIAVFSTLHRRGLTFCILTKSGKKAILDAHAGLITCNDAYAATLTFLDDRQSLEWEPHAALPALRLDGLWQMHRWGIPTWASLEPVIEPRQSLDIIDEAHNYVDVFKVGKLNYHPRAKTIDWSAFAWQAIEKLESYGYRRILNPDEAVKGNATNKLYYIKKDLEKLY